MNERLWCIDCEPTVTGQHQGNCITLWNDLAPEGDVISDPECIICGSDKVAPGEMLCPLHADNWGAIEQIVARWKKAKANEVALRQRMVAVVIYLCDQRGFSELQAAKLLGVSRLTIRAWRGK